MNGKAEGFLMSVDSNGFIEIKRVHPNKRRLVTSALPYVNNEPHLGNLIQVISADVFSRFSKLKGYETLYICGTDEYGTATEMKAASAKKAPYALCTDFFELHKNIYKWFNINFDYFGRTSEANHIVITQKIFQKAFENGYVSRSFSKQFYCPNCKRFLADRYVEGTCPVCSHSANADQCEACGALINIEELKDPKCCICHSEPIIKETENLYLDLDLLENKISSFIEKAQRENRWSSNALSITKSWLNDGLKKRSITRDLNWGIKVPHEDFRNKVFYVWFDAPIGYISLTSAIRDDWQDWWFNPDNVNLYQFIGKDNVVFHTVIFPCTQFATSLNWTMLYKLNSSEYLNFEGGKFSKSKGLGIFGSDCIKTGIPSDLWRFYLNYVRPEKSDSDFSIKDFQHKVNTEVIGNFSNLVNRVYTFTENKFDCKNPTEFLDNNFYEQVKNKIKEVDESFENAEIRNTLYLIFQISDMANKFFQDNEPWKKFESDYFECGVCISTLLNVIKDIAVLLYPFMPSTTEKILNSMNIKLSYSMLGVPLPMNLRITPFGHLFEKISDDLVLELQNKFSKKEEKMENADNNTKKTKDLRLDGESYEEACRRRVNFKVAEVVDIKRHPQADKLYILTLDLNEGENRTIVSSIVPYYKEDELLHHKIIIIANLKPANFRGVKSYGMLLAASEKNDTEHSTCDVLFADSCEKGECIYPQGTTTPVEYGTYLKPEHFSSLPLRLVDGVATVNSVPLVSERTGQTFKSEKYPDGNLN